MENFLRVYELRTFTDDPRFEGFGCAKSYKDISLLSDALPRNRTTRNWKIKRVAKDWKSVAVVGRVRPFNDYPCISGYPAFSQRAVEALHNILAANGELLPLKSSLGKYWAYNITTVADVLDWRRSDVKWRKGEEGISASPMSINRYEFFADKLAGLHIFRLVENAVCVLVTERFVSRVRESGLQGFRFDIVWPLPPSVSWFKLSKDKWRARLREGLPEGQTLKGNTVVIRLLLKGPAASATERRRVDALMDELDALLIVQENPKSPLLGNLEGFDYGAAGECRLFISCPDADKLVKGMRSWLKELEWPGQIQVVKRYGAYVDRNAREEVAAV